MDNLNIIQIENERETSINTNHAEVLKLNEKTIDVKLSNRPGTYVNCQVLGTYFPKEKDKGILLLVDTGNFPVFWPFKTGSRKSGSNKIEVEGESKYKDKVTIYADKGVLTFPTNFTDLQISNGLMNTFQKHTMWGAFTSDMVLNPCKVLNINPFIVLGIAQKESNCGRSQENPKSQWYGTKNPGNIGNTNKGKKNFFPNWHAGWAGIAELIRRRITKYGIKDVYNLGGLTSDAQLSTKFPVWATLDNGLNEAERRHRIDWANSVISLAKQVENNSK